MNEITSLNESNSNTYASRVGGDAPVKHVVRCESPANYVLDWGEQKFDGPHMVVQGDNPYGIALKEFEDTHQKVNVDRYIKFVSVRATQLTEPTTVVTVVAGKVESRSDAPAGAWAVQNPGGEIYVVANDEFLSKYVPK